MTTIVVNGNPIVLDEKGFMIDPHAWDEDVAEALAELNGITLTPLHWEIIRAIHAYYSKYGLPMRQASILNKFRLTKAELDVLFTSKQANKIAGIMQPGGCCL